MGQQHLQLFEHDAFKVATAGEIEILIGDYPSSSDTTTTRYINIGAEQAMGFSITSDDSISLIQVNNRTLKVPRPLAKNGMLVLQRGDWHQFKFSTGVNNITIQMDVVT